LKKKRKKTVKKRTFWTFKKKGGSLPQLSGNTTLTKAKGMKAGTKKEELISVRGRGGNAGEGWARGPCMREKREPKSDPDRTRRPGTDAREISGKGRKRLRVSASSPQTGELVYVRVHQEKATGDLSKPEAGKRSP